MKEDTLSKVLITIMRYISANYMKPCNYLSRHGSTFIRTCSISYAPRSYIVQILPLSQDIQCRHSVLVVAYMSDELHNLAALLCVF